MIAHGAPGFYGKVPAQGDFVRGGIGDPLAQALVRWLEEGAAACYQVQARLPPAPAAFLFRPAGEKRAVLGALRGSQDKVGRHFPLALFVTLDGPELGQAWPSLPAAYAPLLEAMAGVLAEAETIAAPALADRVRALAAPGGAELAAAATRATGDWSAAPLPPAAPLLGGEPGPRYYALQTLRTACAPLRAREPSRAEVLLDCPAASEADRWLWLSLVRQLTGPMLPCFAWRGAGRLLVSLGPFPPAALASLCEPPRDGSKVWPLSTPQAAAQAAAAKALGPVAAQVDRPGITAGELIAALAPSR